MSDRRVIRSVRCGRNSPAELSVAINHRDDGDRFVSVKTVAIDGTTAIVRLGRGNVEKILDALDEALDEMGD